MTRLGTLWNIGQPASEIDLPGPHDCTRFHPPARPALACGVLMKSPRRTASKPSPKRVQTRPNHVHSTRLVHASVPLSKSHLARSHVPTHSIGASLAPLNTKPDFSRSRIEGPPTRILIDVNPPARDSHDDATREREAQAGHDFQKRTSTASKPV